MHIEYNILMKIKIQNLLIFKRPLDTQYYFMKIHDEENDTVQIEVCLNVTCFNPRPLWAKNVTCKQTLAKLYLQLLSMFSQLKLTTKVVPDSNPKSMCATVYSQHETLYNYFIVFRDEWSRKCFPLSWACKIPTIYI